MEDFRDEGQYQMRQLILSLQKIQSRSELLEAEPFLKIQFDEIVDTMISARKFYEAHPSATMVDATSKDLLLSDELQSELYRIYKLDGGRDVIEQVQEKALEKLDLFEKSLEKKKSLRI